MDGRSERDLAEAKFYCEELAHCLPTLVPGAGLTHKSMLPFKATSIRELLIHRMSELASTATAQLELGYTVAGAVLTRAAIETVAVMFCLNHAIDGFLESPDEEKINGFLMSSLVGTRWNDHPVQSVNILTHIDRVTKTFPAFRSSYDSLSEYAHPNWSGLLGSYGTIDRENHELHLGAKDNSPGIGAVLHSLTGALMTFRHYYNLSAVSLDKFNAHFEQQPSPEGT